MKTIFTTITAVIMMLSLLGGCAKDMSGETRTTPAATPTATARATATARPTATAAPKPASTDSAADGVIDEGKDAIDGVVGAGEDAVNDIVDAGEDMVDDVTGRNQNSTSGNGTDKMPAATPKSTSSD